MQVRLGLLAWTAAAAMAALPATALAAVDSFIWFEGEPGNSTDARHKGWFEIQEFAIGGAATGMASEKAEKAKAKEFTIKRVTDSASPTFRQAVTSNRRFPTVKIEMRKAGGKPDELVNYVFTNVFISKLNLSGSGARGPEESITFVYGGMTVHYNKQADQTVPAPAKVLSQPIHK